MKLCRGSRLPHGTEVGAIALLLVASATAQDTKPAVAANDNVAESLTGLQSQVYELKEMVQQLKQETTASRAEITRLRQELESERAAQAASAASSNEQTAPIDVRVGHLEEDQQMLSAKVDTQYQTKVESASKYRVRFAGIALFNLFSTQGTVDSIDVPQLAYSQSGAPSGSFGATLRQSIFGFEVFGPQVMGAKTSGSINFDAGGGFPWVSNGVDMGLVRLR
ncbi:MAG TPA: hypothetical protein VF783_12840, partial [Terriglobales bacterium]